MNLNKILLVALICLGLTSASAQGPDPAFSRKHRFALHLGIGPNYYFNNLVTGKDKVNELNYSLVCRFMWEPEHFLAVGIETGYYRLYTVSISGGSNGTGHIANSAIPIQLVVSMKFCKSFYANFAMGQSFLFNDVTTSNFGNFDAKTFSVADFSGTIGYRYRLRNRFSVGTELKYFYSARLEDSNLALVIMGAYNF